MSPGLKVYLTIGLLAFWALFALGPGRALAVYPDLPETHWADEEVAVLSSRGIVSGYPGGDFSPDKSVSRAELAKMLVMAWRIDGDSWTLQLSRPSFPDLPFLHWAKGYLQLTYEMGWLSGYEDGTLRPDQAINRVEAAVLAVRALGWNDPVPGEDFAARFSDWSTVPGWAREALGRAVAGGLLTGFPDGSIRPLAAITRAEAAAVIDRMLKARGGRFDFSGQLDRVNTEQFNMVIAVHGVRLVFPYRDMPEVFSDGRRSSARKLEELAPVGIDFNLDSDGMLNFIKVVPDRRDHNPAVQLLTTVQAGSLAATSKLSVNSLERLPEDDPELIRATSRSLEVMAEEETHRDRPGRSLGVSKTETGAAALTAASGADGRGVVIAIVDTGLDTTHPDLRFTSDGRPKVIDYKDFTGEGFVKLSGVLPAGHGRYELEGEIYEVVGLPSSGGSYRYGFLVEEDLGWDLNFDGDLTDRFLVLAADSVEAGVFDSVVVGTNTDRRLEGERALRVYRISHETASLPAGPHGGAFSLVLSDLDNGGEWAHLSLDLNGHGTQVAGVVAASGSQFQGLAPGAQLVVLKAAGATGTASPDKLQEAITYAARQGADIINISLGGYRDSSAGHNTLTQTMADLSRDYGVLFTVAAGNGGPGLATVASPGNAQAALSVGAYISPSLWLVNYGYQVPAPTLWYYSSVGPRADGYLAPNIVAPGSAVSSSAGFIGTRYILSEGSSIAAAQAAGAAALLLDAAGRRGDKTSPYGLKRALELGARQLAGFQPVEVGYGVLDARRALDQLTTAAAQPNLESYTYNRLLGFGPGLFLRDEEPAELSFRLFNRGPKAVTLFWRPGAPWLKSLYRETTIPAGQRRDVSLVYTTPEKKGLHSAFLVGDSPAAPGPGLELLSTVIVPYELNQMNGWRQEFRESLPPGQYHRYFFRLPEGVEDLRLDLSVPRISFGASQYQGRVRLQLVAPEGSGKLLTDFAGLPSAGDLPQESVKAVVQQPAAGIWEAVVYSSASLSVFGQDRSIYQLAVRAQSSAGTGGGDTKGLPAEKSLPWLIGLGPQEIQPGQEALFTLSVRDYQTRRPVSGILTINDRVYEIRQGQVTFPALADRSGRVLIKVSQ